ncbi:glycosyltransferase [bacterium]|nr:glycosyltransferase [bacterium]
MKPIALPVPLLSLLPLSRALKTLRSCLITSPLSYGVLKQLSPAEAEKGGEKLILLALYRRLFPTLSLPDREAFPKRIQLLEEFAAVLPGGRGLTVLFEECHFPPPRQELLTLFVSTLRSERQKPSEQKKRAESAHSLLKHALPSLTQREGGLLLRLIRTHFPELWAGLKAMPPDAIPPSLTFEFAKTLRNIGEYSSAERLLVSLSPELRTQETENLLRIVESELAVYHGNFTLSIEHESSPPPSSRRVLFLLENILSEQQSGYTIRTDELFRALTEEGTPVHGVVRPGISAEQEAGSLYSASDDRLPKNYRNIPLDQFFRAYAEGGRAALRDFRPSLLHAVSNFKQAFVAAALSDSFGIPWLYEMRGIWEDSQVAKGEIQTDSERYRFFRALEDRLLHQAHAVTTLSETMKQHLVSRGIDAEKIFLVKNGVSKEYLRTIDQAPAPACGRGTIFGYFGSFSRYEGLADAIRALPLLPETFSLRLCGDGEEREHLLRITEELHLEKRVAFIEPVPPHEVPSVMGDVHALFLLREPLPGMDAVPPMKLYEMLCYGKPLLLTNREIFREVAGEFPQAYWIEKTTPEHMAAEMKKIASELRPERPYIQRTDLLWNTRVTSYHAAWEYAEQTFRFSSHP